MGLDDAAPGETEFQDTLVVYGAAPSVPGETELKDSLGLDDAAPGEAEPETEGVLTAADGAAPFVRGACL